MAVGKRLNQGLPPPTPAPESQLTSTLLRLGSSVQSYSTPTQQKLGQVTVRL